MVQISGVIITFNEEQNIERCLDSISKVVDEIIVVDSFSTDQTKKICLDKGIRFVEHAFESHISQKNFALAQAKYDVILSLDADEYLSDELTASILKVKASWDGKVYRMNRLSMYGEKWIRHGNWYPDKKIRLWDRRIGDWGGQNPHDKVNLNGQTNVIHLKGDILHQSYRNSYEALVKIQSYSDIFAAENDGKKSSSAVKIMIHATFAFFKCYIIKRGFLDGYEGLAVAVSVANHTFYKYAKLYEVQKKNLRN